MAHLLVRFTRRASGARARLLLALALIAAPVAACGSGDSADGASGAASVITTPAVASPTTGPNAATDPDASGGPDASAGADAAAVTTSSAPGVTTPGATGAPMDSAAPVTTSPESTASPAAAPTTGAAHGTNVYAHAGVGDESPAVANARPYVYVPSNGAGTVTVIDQQTMTVVDEYSVGELTQHVVPDWDLTTLYATASGVNRLVPIDPATGTPGAPIPVDAPYNLYFTPDGTLAVVMAERLDRIDFYDRATWTRIASAPTGGCRGVNHADWSADGSFFIATCEFSGDIIKVDTATATIVHLFHLADGAMPQDLRLAPDGSKFYVADMHAGGIWVIDGNGTSATGFIPTGVGAHGIYPSRDASLLYVTNRGRATTANDRRSREGEGSVSIVDPATDTVVATWTIPGGGSPDMGGVSADGATFWVSGRFDDVVYAFDTATGALRATIPVPTGPHGLCVFPQPGRYSLGHTGNFR